MTAAFVFIGAKPLTDWLGDTVALDAAGFIVSGASVQRIDGRHRWRLDRDPLTLETSLPGVFVAGDVRDQSIKRVASAVGEGSMAVQLVHQYLGGSCPRAPGAADRVVGARGRDRRRPPARGPDPRRPRGRASSRGSSSSGGAPPRGG